MSTSPDDYRGRWDAPGEGAEALGAPDRWGDLPTASLPGGMGSGGLQFALASTLTRSPVRPAVSGAGLRHTTRRRRLESFLRNLAAHFA